MTSDIIRRLLSAVLSVALLGLLSSCYSELYSRPKIIDITNDPEWHGELAANRVFRLREAMILQDGQLASSGRVPARSNGVDYLKGVYPRTYLQNPSAYPTMALVKPGTTLKWITARRYLAINHGHYEATSLILDGQYAGRQVKILFAGNPSFKGDLRLGVHFEPVAP
jgi:hypothetical protein